MHNIGLYIYTVKYKSSIKIPGFLRNVSKKISKHFQKEKIFCCIRPNPKIFPNIFFIKKTKIASFSCLKENQLSIRIGPTCQKLFSNLFFYDPDVDFNICMV
jgi:hypothetical protein